MQAYGKDLSQSRKGRVFDEGMALYALICALIAAKMVYLALTKQGPLTFSDESLYIRAARWPMGTDFSLVGKYPPLTALLLSPALALGEGWYMGALMICTIFNTLSLWPIYKISRLYMPAAESFMVVAVCALMPYQYVYPRMLMSENFYYTLVFLAAYLVLRVPRRHPLVQDGILGLVLALMMLTRFVTLVMLPPFLLAWYLRPGHGEEVAPAKTVRQWLHGLRPTPQKLGGFFGMAIVFALVYGGWAVFASSKGVPLKELFGFHIASNTTSEQLTLFNYLFYFSCYFLYLVVSTGAFFGMIMLSLRFLRLNMPKDKFTRLLFLAFGITAALVVASSRHSWRALYNQAGIVKLMGRYVVYCPALFVIVAMAAFHRLSRRAEKPSFRKVILALGFQLLMAGAVFFAYYVICKHIMIVLNDRGPVDVYRIINTDFRFFAGVTLAAILLSAVLRFWAGRRAAALVLSGMICLWYLGGTAAHHTRLVNREQTAIFPREFSVWMERNNVYRPKANLYLVNSGGAETFFDISFFAGSLSFWGRWSYGDGAYQRVKLEDAEKVIRKSGRAYFAAARTDSGFNMGIPVFTGEVRGISYTVYTNLDLPPLPASLP